MKNIFIKSLTLLLSVVLFATLVACSDGSIDSLKDIIGLSFVNKTVSYNGSEHELDSTNSIEVKSL